MAAGDKVIEKSVKYEIEATLKSLGFKGGAKEANAVLTEFNKLEKSTGTLSNRIKIATQAYAQAQKSQEKFKKGMKGVATVFQETSSVLSNLSKSIVGVGKSLLTSGVTGLKSVSILEGLNKSYLQVSATSRVLGVSMGDLTTMAEGATKQMGLTRMEALGLYDIFQKSAIINTSTEAFNKMGAQLRNVVGPNAEAMKALFGDIASVVSQIPSLETNLEIAGSAEKLRAVSESMLGVGSATLPVALGVSAFTQQLGGADAEMSQNLQTLQEFREVSIAVGAAIGSVMMPILQEAVEWFKKMQKMVGNLSEAFKTWIGDNVAKIKAIAVTLGLLSVALTVASVATTALGVAGAIASAGLAPILITVAAIVAGLAGLYYIYKKVSSLFGGTSLEDTGVELKMSEKDAIKKLEDEKKKKADIAKETERIKVADQARLKLINDAAKSRAIITKQIGSEVGHFQSLVKQQQISGNISEKEIAVRRDKINKSIDASITKQRKYIAAEQERMSKLDEGTDAHNMLLTNVTNAEKTIIDLENQRIEVGLQQAQIYDTQIGLASKSAGIQKQLVSLADNFAIGLGASVAVRMRAVGAISKEISVMKQKERMLKQEMAINGQTDKGREKVLEMQGKILGKQVEQAQMLKSLRDGWISAIGAMNTGAGRYTKILMNAQKNTAQIVKLGGVVSAMSGSLQGGYTSSARFSAYQSGGITGQRGGMGPGGALPYQMYGSESGAPVLEAALRGDVQGAMSGLGNYNAGRNVPVSMSGQQGPIGAISEQNIGSRTNRVINEAAARLAGAMVDKAAELYKGWNPDTGTKYRRT